MPRIVKEADEKTEGAKWTFLTNHTRVLVLIAKNPELVLREVSLKVGITERAVQRIIAELEREDFISRKKVGRKNAYKLNLKKPLRHPVEKLCTIGDLVEFIIDQT